MAEGVPDTHEGFSLSKKEQDDVTIGLPNQTNLLCPTCYLLIAPKGTTIKIQKNVSYRLLYFNTGQPYFELYRCA